MFVIEKKEKKNTTPCDFIRQLVTAKILFEENDRRKKLGNANVDATRVDRSRCTTNVARVINNCAKALVLICEATDKYVSMCMYVRMRTKRTRVSCVV